jgi:hypothetical protein
LERVLDLAKAVRTIGPPRSGIEAFAPRDAADDALEVLKLHAEHRERTVTIEASSAPPTRVPRWMFVRSLIALGVAAGTGMRDRTAHLRIAILEDGPWVAVRAEGVSARSAVSSPYMSELARAMGGEPLEKELGFRVPTLAALRQREGR